MLVSLRLISCCVLDRGIMDAKETIIVVTADADMIATVVEESVGGGVTMKDEVREE